MSLVSFDRDRRPTGPAASLARSVPADVLAERAVLGAVLLERDAILAISDTLQADDFYLEKHALIYQAMLACLAQRVPPDLATVAAALRRSEPLDLVGGSGRPPQERFRKSDLGHGDTVAARSAAVTYGVGSADRLARSGQG